MIMILALGAAALTWGWLDGPAARQRRGIAAATAFSRQLAPKLAADPRFAAVDTSVTTNPALRVFGEVPDEQSLRDLNALLPAGPGARFRTTVDVSIADVAAARPAQPGASQNPPP